MRSSREQPSQEVLVKSQKYSGGHIAGRRSRHSSAGTSNSLWYGIRTRDVSDGGVRLERESPEQESSFGTRLRRLRGAAGPMQEELAFWAGLSPNAVGDLERGKTRRPYPHTARSLADALSLSKENRATPAAAVPGRGVVAGDPQPIPKTDLPTPPTLLVDREPEPQEVRTFLGRSGCRRSFGARRIEMFWLLGATSELDRGPSFILDMVGCGMGGTGLRVGAPGEGRRPRRPDDEAGGG